MIETDDGSLTAHHKILGDLYHSSRGAVGESLYVYIENALKYYLELTSKTEISVFDMGLGAGLNAWLTLENIPHDVKVRYITIEKYPLSFDEQIAFKYSDSELYKELLLAPWNKKTKITENFSIYKIEGDVLDLDFKTLSPLNVIYWDAFSPDSQSELWSSGMFSKLKEGMSYDAILTTYSAKGIVKKALRDSGFIVKRLPGALGKHHMLRAFFVY